MITNNGANADLRGKSTDEKPTNAAPNTLYLELDTGTFYFFDGDTETWELVGGSEE